MHFLAERWKCTHIERAVRTQWQSVDFFAADVMGKSAKMGLNIYGQVTTGATKAVQVRRRKLEKVPWHHNERVFLFQLVSTDDPVNKNKKRWWFRIHQYHHQTNIWEVWDAAQEIPPSWFKAWKTTEEDNGRKQHDSNDGEAPGEQDHDSDAEEAREE